MSEVINKTKISWKWKPKRWWIGLILFWFICSIGAGAIARSGGYYGQESGFIIMVMLFFAIWAACTDRAWSISIRVIWVIGLWIIHALLLIPIVFTLGPLVYAVRPLLVDRAMSLFAAFPLIIWAMRRSKFFVEPVVYKEEKQ